jgi:hypothetical protein
MESLTIDKIYNAIERVEKRLTANPEDLKDNEGVFKMEIVQILERNQNTSIGEVEANVDPLLLDLITSNRIYFSSDVTRLSVKPLKGFLQWKDMQSTVFKGLKLDSNSCLANDGAPTIEFDNLRRVLLSKRILPKDQMISRADFEKNYKEYKSIHLDGTKKVSKVVMSSYFRSGNTMMRKILEDATGVVTGSIYNNKVYVNYQLMFNGFKGEGRHDDSAWLLKSHFPVQWPGSQSFSASRALVCARNPIDIISSYINLMITSCHSINIDNDIHLEFPEFWTWYVEYQTDQYV